MKNKLTKIILLENLRNWGKYGDVVSVRKGYFKNHLAPKGIATIYSEEIHAQMQSNKEKKIEAQRVKHKAIINALGEPSVIIRTNASAVGVLFGAISNAYLQKLVEEKYKVRIPKSSFVLKDKIRTTGEYLVKIILGLDAVDLKVVIENASERGI
jgi:large subunit ribosomal protein L9